MPSILDAFPAELECDTLVFRAIRSGWVKDESITSQAFILRRFVNGSLETGLSVGNNVQTVIDKLDKSKSVVSLHVGRVKDIDLDVIPDRAGATHAQIKELPPPEDIREAERIATALLNQTREAWQAIQ